MQTMKNESQQTQLRLSSTSLNMISTCLLVSVAILAVYFVFSEPKSLLYSVGSFLGLAVLVMLPLAYIEAKRSISSAISLVVASAVIAPVFGLIVIASLNLVLTLLN